MAMNIAAEVSRWKKTQFSSYDMRLDVAVNSLLNDEVPRIEFKGYHPSRLNAMFRENQETAVLTWAGIYAGGYDIDTGNLVPPGEKAPSCVPQDKIMREFDWKCAYHHSIDTTVDRSLYKLQTAIENYLMRDPNFNPSNRPHRDFQNPLKVDATPRYTFQTRMFVKKNDRAQSLNDQRRSKKMKWHPWVTRVLENRDQYYPNPEKPAITEWRHGQFHDIHKCKPPFLQAGDVVWFSLKLTVVVTSSTWYTEFLVEEIVRVLAIPEGVDLTGNPVVDSVLRPRLSAGSILVPQSYDDLLDVEACNLPSNLGGADTADTGREDAREGGHELAGAVSPLRRLATPLSTGSRSSSPLTWVQSEDEQILDAIGEVTEDM